MTEKDFSQIELHALAVYNYMVEFEILDKSARQIFCTSVKYMNSSDKIPYFFYLAGLRSSSIELQLTKSTPIIHCADLSFSESENFKSMTLNTLLKIQAKHGIQSCHDFFVSSINFPSIQYPFIDCCKKFISMRNKLAHERSSLSFNERDIVELLPDFKIEDNANSIYGSLSTSSMSNETKAIFSNFVMMTHALQELRKHEEVLHHERLD